MTEIINNTPKKVLTDEEKQKRREYNRAYMAKRRLEPEFLAKQQEVCRKSRQRPEAKEKERIRNLQRDRSNYFCERYKKQKERYEELTKQIEDMEKKIKN